jgi:hypothetical protein
MEYCSAMSFLIFSLVLIAVALGIWLTVRVVNHRQRWSKWGLGVLVVLAVLYPLSWGPALWSQASGLSP